MKNILKIFGGGIAFLLAVMIIMAVLNICPPQGPWPQPPWCPGSSFPWPFSDPVTHTTAGDDSQSDPVANEQAASGDEQQSTGEGVEFSSEISEDERLARVAIGLMQDLTTVNTYFNDAASSFREIDPAGGGSGSGHNNAIIEFPPGSAEIPSGFTDPLTESGFIPAPDGACAVGASPSASFLNGKDELITAALLNEKNIQVIGFDELTGGSIDGRKLEQTLTSLIPTGDPALLTPEGWNQKVWSKMADYQTTAISLMDYHLWTVAPDIEQVVVESILARMEGMGLPAQAMNALKTSNIHGWYASPGPENADKIAAMEIEAVFSGKTEGTIYEERDFSIPGLGEMPEFGPMTGEGSVVYHDPDFGDYPFDLEINWTKWDQLGRVTEGEIVFTDQEHDVVIEMSILEDNSRTANVFREGEMVGIVNVDSGGMTTYEDLTE